jgi:diamine N-acetyltransferase
MAHLTLQELTAQTIVAANGLTLKPGQEAFLKPETYTHAEEGLDPAGSWPRVVMDGDRVVGYIMGSFDRDSSEDYLRAALWRIEVSDDAQGMGVGRFAVQGLADEARARGYDRVTVVFSPCRASPTKHAPAGTTG